MHHSALPHHWSVVPCHLGLPWKWLYLSLGKKKNLCMWNGCSSFARCENVTAYLCESVTSNSPSRTERVGGHVASRKKGRPGALSRSGWCPRKRTRQWHFIATHTVATLGFHVPCFECVIKVSYCMGGAGRGRSPALLLTHPLALLDFTSGQLSQMPCGNSIPFKPLATLTAQGSC